MRDDTFTRAARTPKTLSAVLVVVGGPGTDSTSCAGPQPDVAAAADGPDQDSGPVHAQEG